MCWITSQSFCIHKQAFLLFHSWIGGLYMDSFYCLLFKDIVGCFFFSEESICNRWWMLLRHIAKKKNIIFFYLIEYYGGLFSSFVAVLCLYFDANNNLILVFLHYPTYSICENPRSLLDLTKRAGRPRPHIQGLLKSKPEQVLEWNEMWHLLWIAWKLRGLTKASCFVYCLSLCHISLSTTSIYILRSQKLFSVNMYWWGGVNTFDIILILFECQRFKVQRYRSESFKENWSQREEAEKKFKRVKKKQWE